MATNPSIILGYHPADIPDPLETRVRQGQLSMLAGQQQLQQQQLVGAQQENQQRALQMQQTQTLNEAYKNSLTIGADGTATVDHGKLTQALASGGAGSRIPDVLKGVNEYQKSIADLGEANGKVAALQNDAAGGLGATVKNADYDPHLFLTLSQHALDAKAVDPKFVAPMIGQVQQALQQDPTGASAKALVQQLSDHFISQSPAQQKLINEGQTAQGGLLRGQAARDNANREQVQADTQSAATTLANTKTQADYTAAWEKLPAGVARKFPPPEAWTPQTSADSLRVGMNPAQQQEANDRAAQLAKLNTPSELAFKAAKGDKDAQAALDLLKRINISERQASNPNVTVNLTPGGQKIYDQSLLTTGQAVSIPRGPGGTQVIQSLNRLGASAPDTNLGANKADFAADKTSLTNMTKMRDAVVTFEKTATANLDLFLNAAAKIPDLRSPWANTPLRLVDEKLAGSANLAAVNAARQVANNEIAKVTSNPNLSGALSDSARHEVEAFNPNNATFAQTLAVARVLKQDMANRHKFLDQGVQEIKGRIGGTSGAKPNFQVGDSVMYNGAAHKITAIKPNGKLVLDGGQ